MKFKLALVLFVLSSISVVSAQEFYLKTGETSFEKSPWPLKFSFDRYTQTKIDPKTNEPKEVPFYKLRLTDRRLLTELAEQPELIPFNAIMPRELTTLEKSMVEEALVRAKNTKSKAAKLLGLTRAQLYSRLQKYGLS